MNKYNFITRSTLINDIDELIKLNEKRVLEAEWAANCDVLYAKTLREEFEKNKAFSFQRGMEIQDFCIEETEKILGRDINGKKVIKANK